MRMNVTGEADTASADRQLSLFAPTSFKAHYGTEEGA